MREDGALFGHIDKSLSRARPWRIFFPDDFHVRTLYSMPTATLCFVPLYSTHVITLLLLREATRFVKSVSSPLPSLPPPPPPCFSPPLFHLVHTPTHHTVSSFTSTLITRFLSLPSKAHSVSPTTTPPPPLSLSLSSSSLVFAPLRFA